MDVVEPGRYSCPKCEERFGSIGDKKRHMRDCREEPNDG